MHQGEVKVGALWEPCDTTCQTCSGTTATDCLTCFPADAIQADGSCAIGAGGGGGGGPSGPTQLILSLSKIYDPILEQSEDIYTYSLYFGTNIPI
jgi:hypothetical protein